MPNATKKFGRSSNERVGKSRKKKFQGNQFSRECDTNYVSTSAKKLKKAEYDEIPVDITSNYVILHFLNVFSFLSTFVKCEGCNSEVKFYKTNGAGVAFKVVAECSCSRRSCDSSPVVNHFSEINRRLMFAIRMLRGGLRNVKMFCAILDITSSFSNNMYYTFLQNLHVASKSVYEVFQKKAIKEEIDLNSAAGNEPLHLTVSGDGSWKKRGFTSLFGVATLIGKFTNKVLDFVVRSAFCQSCANWKSKQGSIEYNLWKESHDEECSANHHGSAGKMEVDAVREMFTRSTELLGVKYENYIGDGDTKTFKSILNLNPYDHLIVKKKECVGHVQKRMGSRLRAVKQKTKGLGGKGAGKLTNKVISDLTIYYGLAIRRNKDSLEKMKAEIWAVFYHNISTDENPQHSYCPAGKESWCKWRVAEAYGTVASFKHKQPLSQKVQDAIKPVFEALSTDDLLNRCLGGNTQNSNESVNACIWKLAPKHLHCGAQTVEIASYIAISLFNEGYTILLKIMNTLGIAIGLEINNFVKESDNKRITSAEVNMTDGARAAALAKKSEQLSKIQQFEVEEGLLYGPGIAD